ncbi:MAG TPA: PAS domain S-box protein [Polyangiales bacterium]|nr:PAS domain S-box protein [Polyangiales bacterium]
MSLLSDLFAATDEMIFLLAGDGTVLYVTPSGERAFGAGGGDSLPNAFAGPRRASLEAMIALMSTADPIAGAHRELTLERGRAWYSLRVSAARWNERKAVLVIVRDAPRVAPEMMADQQRALTRSENLFRALSDNDLFGITVQDALGKYVEVNSTFERTTGIAREHALGHDPEELGLITPGVQDQYLEQLSADGSSKLAIMPLVGRDGRTFTWMSCSTMVRLDGTPMVFTIAFDVTEFQHSQEELRESDSKFRALFDNIVDAMFFVDRSGRFIEVNPAACTQLGYTRDELLARSALEVLGGNEFDFAEVQQRLRRFGQLSFESTQQRRDGTTFPMGMTLAAIEHRGSHAVAGIGRDLSERKEREDELTRINDELMRFAYTVSHDLKSPLVTIRSFLGYLKEDLASHDYERVARDIAHMERAAERMGCLLDDVLELSRIGRKVNPPERVELAELVRAASELVAGRMAAAGAELVLLARGIVLWGDRSRLLEVFQNLIDNAVKFAQPGVPPRIVITADRQLGELVIAVRDNGIGIDPRYHHKLFGLFEKLHAQAEGTGIGLALVKRIMEVHGGRVWVESDGEGTGTAVCFVLPGTTATTEEP